MRRMTTAFLAASASAAQPLTSVPQKGPIPETSEGVGYPSVAAALAALRAKPSVKITEQHGWTIAEEPETPTLWSFTPPGHPPTLRP